MKSHFLITFYIININSHNLLNQFFLWYYNEGMRVFGTLEAEYFYDWIDTFHEEHGIPFERTPE